LHGLLKFCLIIHLTVLL